MNPHQREFNLQAPSVAVRTTDLQDSVNQNSIWPTLLVGVMTCVAFWPLGPWYLGRVMSVSERMCALLAFLTFCVVIIRDRATGQGGSLSLALPTLLMILYAISSRFLPGLATAALAMLTIATLVGPLVYGVRIPLAVCGLLLLSLPLLSRLQFFLGFPLRVVVGALATPLLQMAGQGVVREGAVLRSGTELIVIDAPCSGIKMMWAAAYLTCTLCCFYRFSAAKTGIVGLGAFALVLIGNVLRSTALFFFEIGTIDSSPLTHSGTGVVAFLGVTLGILWMVRRLERRRPCVD